MGEPVGDRKGQQRIVSASDNGAWPPLLIPRNGRIAKITDVPPLEMARQLTIIEFQHFQNITMNECLNKRWTGTGCDHLAPNIRAIIRMANVVAGWVTTCIIGQRDVKARAGMVKYWIQTSQVRAPRPPSERGGPSKELQREVRGSD
jgi:son of sevenless-like protein